eukprot:TRINITY_DN468_c0_g2_i1.p1 TRINITY_DN468_c0_g2~~TRINITY_DN468_c0_g2_i1.p1  ORF type:complete len:220 (+),score=24.37 TRINITY_DN468_c0_g2_i1:100-660(+)
MGPEFRRRVSYIKGVVQQQSNLLDWYRSTSFVLTGHMASVKRMAGYLDCDKAQLRGDTDPFFAQLTTTDGAQVAAPAWGALMAWVETGALADWLPQADSWDGALELLRRREVGRLWSTWDLTPASDRPRLLKSWMEGPSAVYPTTVPNMSYPYDCLPPVHREAAIHTQIRETKGTGMHEKLFVGHT